MTTTPQCPIHRLTSSLDERNVDESNRNANKQTRPHGCKAKCLISTVAERAATVPITSDNDICNRYQHRNFGEAQADSSLMMVYINRNMLEQTVIILHDFKSLKVL